MLRMISTIFSTLEKLRQQQVVQSCVTVKGQLQILAPAASSHKMPAIYILSNGEVAGFSLKEYGWPASGEWCGHSSNGSNTTNAGISKTFWETCGSMFRRRETKSEDPSRSAKRQSTAEPSTAVALCTAMSYILSRGIVHLDTNDTKIKDEILMPNFSISESTAQDDALGSWHKKSSLSKRNPLDSVMLG